MSVHATHLCAGVIVYIYKFLTLVPDGAEGSDAVPGRFNPGGRFCGFRYVTGRVTAYDTERKIVYSGPDICGI